MRHPQRILASAMDRSNLTDGERADAAEEMYFSVLELLLDELPEGNPPEDLERACGIAAGPEIAPDPAHEMGEGPM